jgi:hypothetical protein
VYKDIAGFERGKTICLIHDKKPQYINWDVFRTAINEKILDAGFDEDRCIGSYYFSNDELNKIKKYAIAEDRKNLPNPLVDKLLSYLRQDLFRMNPAEIFKSEDNKYNMSAIRSRISNNEDILGILNIEIDKVKNASTELLRWNLTDNSGEKGNPADNSGEEVQAGEQ